MPWGKVKRGGEMESAEPRELAYRSLRRCEEKPRDYLEAMPFR